MLSANGDAICVRTIGTEHSGVDLTMPAPQWAGGGGPIMGPYVPWGLWGPWPFGPLGILIAAPWPHAHGPRCRDLHLGGFDRIWWVQLHAECSTTSTCVSLIFIFAILVPCDGQAGKTYGRRHGRLGREEAPAWSCARGGWPVHAQHWLGDPGDFVELRVRTGSARCFGLAMFPDQVEGESLRLRATGRGGGYDCTLPRL